MELKKGLYGSLFWSYLNLTGSFAQSPGSDTNPERR